MPRNKRRRTGCLSCRQRRVKCDERKPSCERCEAANIVCAGYSQMRRIEPEPRTRRNAVFPANTQRSVVGHVSGSSLAPLPNSPRPDQSPGSGARHVLGYHHFLSKTLPLLFPPEHMCFWTDVLCQEAWGSEYVHLTLTALGNLHRAVIMMASCEETVQQAGLNEKLSAVQQYTQALQEMADHLDDARSVPKVLVGVLCLMAYFEAFSGNLPACVGHLRVATYYLRNILSSPSSGDAEFESIQYAPLNDCLESLSQTCRIALPSLAPSIFSSEFPPYDRPTLLLETSAALTVAALQELLAMARNNEDMEQLIWNPIAAYDRLISPEDINGFQEQLLEWQTRHEALLPDLDRVVDTNGLLGNDWQAYLLPPQGYPAVSRHANLAAAHYNFYMARMKWALCIRNESPEDNELSAYNLFYKALRCAVTQPEEEIDNTNVGDTYLAPEGMTTGFLPLLHIIGLCCPHPSWLHWIRNTCASLQQEGIFKGHTFSTTLDCFHTFDLHSRRHSLSLPDKYPAPASRVMCQLIPEPDGRNYVAYFARVRVGNNFAPKDPKRYSILGHARWRCYQGEHPCKPDLHIYGEETCVTDLSAWLSSRPAAVSWREWATHSEFDMEHALQDHINGARLLSSPEDSHDVFR